MDLVSLLTERKYQNPRENRDTAHIRSQNSPTADGVIGLHRGRRFRRLEDAEKVGGLNHAHPEDGCRRKRSRLSTETAGFLTARSSPENRKRCLKRLVFSVHLKWHDCWLGYAYVAQKPYKS